MEELADAIITNHPFFANEVYVVTSGILEFCSNATITRPEEKDINYADTNEELKLWKDKVLDAIRQRIKIMSSIPSDQS